MGATTEISWCDHTFNPWIGCTKVSEACRYCYAERDNNFRKWNGGTWGPGAPRKVTSEANWRKPLRWNERAIADGVRRRVFTASLADVFDAEAPGDAQARLFDLIEECDGLDWLVLTKRPENALSFFAERWGHRPSTIPPHLWVGVSVENQKAADERVPVLLQIPTAVRFLSMEPLLGPVNLGLLGTVPRDISPRYTLVAELINLVITGAESGPYARPSHPDWFRSTRDECVAAGVAYHHKQNGEWVHGFSNVRPCIERHGTFFTRVGKKAAGRLLDGELWDQMPAGVGATR